MPIYEYLCERGHRFDVLQKMSDDPVAICEVCGDPVQRVLHPVAIHFKGSGFYTTDYGRGKGAKADGTKDSAAASSSSSDGGSSSSASSNGSSGSSSSATGATSSGSSSGSSSSD
jgi:putative FmdB family regulatory protein